MRKQRWTAEQIAAEWRREGRGDDPDLDARAESLATEIRRMGYRLQYRDVKYHRNEVPGGADPHDSVADLDRTHRLHREPWYLERQRQRLPDLPAAGDRESE